MIARKINTPLLLPFHRSRRQSAATFVVFSETLDASSILCRCLHCRCCSLCANLPLPTPPSLSPIPKDPHHDAAASVVFPESSPPPLSPPIPQTRHLFIVLLQRICCRRRLRGPVSERLLTFGFLTLYFLWGRFAPVTVERASIPYLVCNDTVEKVEV